MKKRILTVILITVMCLSWVYISGEAQTVYADSYSIDAAYSEGVVTVTGTGFSTGAAYIVRVVDIVNSSIKAMGQTKADGSGNISASVTTGLLERIENCKVYVNNMEGALVGSAVLSEGGEEPTPTPTPTPTPKPKGSSGSAPTPTPTPISSEVDGDTAKLSYAVASTMDEKGKACGEITSKTFSDMVAKAKEDKYQGKKMIFEFKMDIEDQNVAAEFKIAAAGWKEAVKNKNTEIKLSTGFADITFDEKAAAAIGSKATSEDIYVSILPVDKSALSDEAREKVGDRPVYDITIKAGNSEVTDLEGGKAKVSISYTPKPGEDLNAILIYYIDSEGNLKPVRGKYNAAAGRVEFTVTHFSIYAVGYNKVTFSDVASNAWYSGAVSFTAARGIVQGVGGGRFEPDANVKRADFLIMVMRAYGIEPDKEITDNFADAGDKYYTAYLGTAKRLGLVSGVGNNLFAPEERISRQDVFVILYRILDMIDELPEGETGRALESFEDSGKVAGYAREAMSLFTRTGITAGDGVNLMPDKVSTRAEAVQMLYNILSK